MVPQAFNGWWTFDMQSVRQTAQIVMILPKRIMDAIRNIAIRDDLVLCYASEHSYTQGLWPIAKLSSPMDFRPSLKVLHSCSLKASEAFLDAEGGQGEFFQVPIHQRASYFVAVALSVYRTASSARWGKILYTLLMKAQSFSVLLGLMKGSKKYTSW